jgi:hypothetical protein
MRSDSILFDQSIPAGQTVSLERLLPFNGRVTKMTITNYPGQQKSLQVTPYMLRAPDLYVSLATFAGNRKFFSGDETTYNIAMSMPFYSQDKLCVDVTNTSANAYDLYVLYEIEFEVG